MRIIGSVVGVAAALALAAAVGQAQTGDVFSSGSGTGGNSTGRTGTQGIEGNPNCGPPMINGITPKNWSCRTGSQAVRGLPPVGYGDEPAAATTPSASPSPGFSVAAVLSSIENCWVQTFLANGRKYVPPLAFPSSAYPGSAAYNPATKAIIYNPAVLNAQAANNGTMSVIVTLAHELGHSVQDQTGRLGHEVLRKDAELQADMLAGVAARCLDARGALGTGALGAAAWGRYVKGDAATTPAFARQAHGAPSGAAPDRLWSTGALARQHQPGFDAAASQLESRGENRLQGFIRGRG